MVEAVHQVALQNSLEVVATRLAFEETKNSILYGKEGETKEV